MRLWECGRYCKVCSRRVLVAVLREERLIGRRVVGGWERGRLHSVRRKVRSGHEEAVVNDFNVALGRRVQGWRAYELLAGGIWFHDEWRVDEAVTARAPWRHVA